MGRLGHILGRLRSLRSRGDANAESVAHPDDEWWVSGIETSEVIQPIFNLPSDLPDTASHPDEWFLEADHSLTGIKKSHFVEADVVHANHTPDDLDILPIDFALLPSWAAELTPSDVPDFPIETPEAEHVQQPLLRRLSPERRRALARAAQVVDCFEYSTRQRADEIRSLLAELFQQNQHQSSIRAIANMADAGATIEEVFAAAELRECWFETPSLWLRRRYDGNQGWVIEGGVSQLKEAMTWRFALRLIQAFPGECPEEILSESKLDRWVRLPRRSRPNDPKESAVFFSFKAFLNREAALAESKIHGSELMNALSAYSEAEQNTASNCQPFKYMPTGLPIGIGDASPSIWIGRALAPSEQETFETES